MQQNHTPVRHVNGDPVGVVTPINQHLSQRNNGHVHVLHVDDDPDFVELTATFLERVTDDITVVSETRADDGLERLDENTFDCIVSDYQMPGKDGLQFLESVRYEYPELPFILFTGKGSEEIASEAIAAGVTDYLQKGRGTNQYEVLENRIRNVVDKYRSTRELSTALSWYQRLVEQTLTGIYLIQDEEFVYVNAKFAEIFGYAQEELIGRSALDVVASDHRDTARENLRKRQQGEVDNVQYSLTGKTKQGDHLEIEVHGGVVDFEGEPAILGTLLAVTE